MVSLAPFSFPQGLHSRSPDTSRGGRERAKRFVREEKVLSQVKIANRALGLLGANRIVSIADNSLEAKSIANVWDDTLKSVLSEAPWGFAIESKMLNKVDRQGAWSPYGVLSFFQLPSDLVKITAYSNNSAYIKRRGNFLAANVTELGIEYVYFMKDTTQFPIKFVEALACKLAADICYDLTNSDSKAMGLLELYNGQYLPAALTENAREGSQDNIIADEWVNSMHGGG